MNLYDFLQKTESDYDTYDSVFDACVTVCYVSEDDIEPGDPWEASERFTVELYKRVEVDEESLDDYNVVVHWSKLIQQNFEKFRAFSFEHWQERCRKFDDDTLIYEWIREINHYLAGYVSESFYKILLPFVLTLES